MLQGAGRDYFFPSAPLKAPRAAPAAQTLLACLADPTTSPRAFGCCSPPPSTPKAGFSKSCFRGNNRYGLGSQQENVLVLPLAFMRCRRLGLASPRHHRRLSAPLPEECTVMGNLLGSHFPCPHDATPSSHSLLGVPEPPVVPQTSAVSTHNPSVILRD